MCGLQINVFRYRFQLNSFVLLNFIYFFVDFYACFKALHYNVYYRSLIWFINCGIQCLNIFLMTAELYIVFPCYFLYIVFTLGSMYHSAEDSYFTV